MSQPTELQLQAAAMSAVATMIRSAALAGVPQNITPTWCVVGGFVDGNFRSSDDSALRALEAWRKVLGRHHVGTYVHQAEGGPRRIWTVTVTVSEVSVRLCASIPAELAPRREAVAA